MQDVITIIQTLGFPIACVVALAVFTYKIVTRDKDEAIEREKTLIESNQKNSEALSKVADTIQESNKINSALSETNRILIDKIETKLDGIDSNLGMMLERLK